MIVKNENMGSRKMRKRIGALMGVMLFICLSLFAFGGCQKKRNGDTRYEIIAEYVPENKTLTGVVKVTFENFTNNELDVLKFQLYPNLIWVFFLYKIL